MGWFVLSAVLIGGLFTFSQSENRKLKKSSEDRSKVIAKNNRDFRRLAAVILVAAVAMNFYSEYQHTQQINSEIASSESALKSLGWCENNQASPDGGGGFNTYGGWPCIVVSSDDGVRKGPKDSHGYEQLCSNVTFKREVGLPGENIFQDYKTSFVCAIAEGASTYFKDSVYAEIQNDLKQLNNSLCVRLQNQLDELTRSTFCYML